MFDDVKRMLAHKIRLTQPGIPDLALRLLLAKQMYGSDMQLQVLLKGQALLKGQGS
jgi:hypothetical protein